MKRALALVALVLCALAAAPQAATSPTPEPEPSFTPSPQRLLGLIRARFRSHRPPPPYVTYTLVRAQKTDRGFVDYVGSYTYHIWCRNLDRAALGRQIFRLGAIGDPEFQRPAFNEDRDPGPPTADIFEPAPARPTQISDVPTPEPANVPFQIIGRTTVAGEYDYAVDDVKIEGDQYHLILRPLRDPERNRLREVFANKDTYEVTRLITHDRLFVPDEKKIYNATFDVRVQMLQGTPVVTSIHGDVGSTAGGEEYSGDGKVVDFTFKDIKFPATLPDWYFDSRSYGAHKAKGDLPV
jgi:hypothetical protein